MVRPLWSVFLLVCLWSGAFGLPPGDPNSWEIQASLFTSSAKDTQNFVGVDSGCADGLDSGDILEPPGLPGKLCLRVEHDDGRARARDICAPLTALHSWNLTATSLAAGKYHFILFEGLHSVPAEYTIALVDPTARVTHDLRSAPDYVFLPEPGEKERSLKIQVINPPPAPPKKLDALAGEECADLRWEEEEDGDVVGYTVYMGTLSGDYDRSWEVGLRTDFHVPDLEYGQEYYFAVSAVDRSSLEGGLSPEARVSMEVIPTPTPEPEPVMMFDMDDSGTIDYRDLFSLAGSWMYPVKLTPDGGRPIFRNVSPSLLTEFTGEWRTFRPIETTQKNMPLPTPELPAVETEASPAIAPMEEDNNGQ